MRFAHLGDCHLGGWRHPELNQLNFQSFQTAIKKIIKEKLDFALVTGDLFDSAYPPIETLKETFREFRRLKESNIPVFVIAGSHDYSVSGKSFLDVLEHAGLCRRVLKYEERNGKIILSPTIFNNVALYGYPGKKSGLEISEIERIKLNDSPGLFKILMLHTTIEDAVRGLPIKAVDHKKLPAVDYLALSHLHINYQKENRAYSGPIFPNNLTELEDLKAGSFYIYDNGKILRQEIKLKDVVSLRMEIKNAMSATDEIIKKLSDLAVTDKIVILRLFGIVEIGKTSDIDFIKISRVLKQKGAFIFLKSTSALHMVEPEVKLEITSSEDLENQVIERFEKDNPSKFNSLIGSLNRSLQMEKQEGEKNAVFEERVIAETKKILQRIIPSL